MHGVNHGCGGAGAAERVADIDDVGNAGALTAEFARHRRAQQPLGARRIDRFDREPRIGVDRGGMCRRNRRDLLGARG
jgi:hypothetical protein